VALGANPVVANLDMCDVVKFETELAKSTLHEEERRRVDIRYNKISILELSLRYPKIDLVRYIRIVLSTANIKIDLNSKVILWAAPYFDRLTKIIANTSMRTLANYILFRAIDHFVQTVC
jgi:predicted metalloendopeptidase